MGVTQYKGGRALRVMGVTQYHDMGGVYYNEVGGA